MVEMAQEIRLARDLEKGPLRQPQGPDWEWHGHLLRTGERKRETEFK